MIPDQTQASVSSARKMTVEEFFAFCALPEHADRHFELIDGEVAEKEMASLSSSQIGGEIYVLLRQFLRSNPLGRLTPADGSYELPNGDVLMPDVGYISLERMPQLPERQGLLPPDLAVEVMSPTDRLRAARQKAELYITNEVRLVWLVNPKLKQVEIYTPDGDLKTLNANDMIDGGAVLPGFSCRVAEFFPEG